MLSDFLLFDTSLLNSWGMKQQIKLIEVFEVKSRPVILTYTCRLLILQLLKCYELFSEMQSLWNLHDLYIRFFPCDLFLFGDYNGLQEQSYSASMYSWTITREHGMQEVLPASYSCCNNQNTAGFHAGIP